MEKKEPKKEYNKSQCVYAPFIPECQHCNKEVKPINGTIICDGNKTGIVNDKWQGVFTRY